MDYLVFVGDYLDWFITKEQVANRTGEWYVGVVSVKVPAGMNITEVVNDGLSCEYAGLTKDILDWDFNMTHYIMRTYTAGMLYFDVKLESWDGIGITIKNTTNLVTACETNHLTSFATGWFPEPNTIDFNFVFAIDSFSDNSTIFTLLIITIILYLICMIWATWKDIKDDKRVSR